jgi:hypothetical protein
MKVRRHMSLSKAALNKKTLAHLGSLGSVDSEDERWSAITYHPPR